MNSVNRTIQDWPLPKELLAAEGLHSFEGGLVQYASEISEPSEETHIFATSMGKLEALHPNIRRLGSQETGVELGGAGGDANPRMARAIAIVESVERYSSCVPPKDLLWATYNSVKRDAVDIDLLPKCSSIELSDPQALATAFNKQEPVRWTWAKDLRSGEKLLIPAVLVWLHLPPITASERAWMQVSTGCAAHTTIEQALVNAICEVVERDAIALTWLQRLQLPRIELKGTDPRIAEIERDIAATGRKYQFFDATTDVGVPTVYCLDVDPVDEELRTVVMAAADLDPVHAVAKIVRETRSSRYALRNAAPPPPNVEDFTHVFHGAKLLGQARFESKFSFLNSREGAPKSLSELMVNAGVTPNDKLTWLIQRLSDAGYTVLASDISTAEAHQVGIHVVRVVIPELMPLSFVHRVRYLGHPRLYEAPLKMGLRSFSETELNPLPQPFA